MSELLNECFEEQEQVIQIMSDADAERILDQIKDLRAEKARFKMILDTRVQELTLNYDCKAEKIDNEEAWLTHLLQSYFEGKDIQPTKAGNKSYKLLSGTLKLKKQQPEFKRDEDKLTEWLKKMGHKDFVETIEKPKWGEFKKGTIIKRETIVDEDGVITSERKFVVDAKGNAVDGVEVIERPEKFEVEL